MRGRVGGMDIYILDTEPRAETLDDEPGMAEYALRNGARPDTIICYMWLPVEDAGMWGRLLNSQAGKAWREGCAEGLAFDWKNGAVLPDNPFTVQSDD